MSAYKNVILIGGAGLIGKHILRELLAAGTFQVSVLTRDTSTASFPSGVSVKKTDYTHASLVAALRGQDAVVSAIGGPALAAQTQIADAALEAGVKRFIPSEYGCDTQNPKTAELVPVFPTKVGVIEHLKKNQSRMEWTGLSTGPFFDMGIQTGFLGFHVPTATATIYSGGTQKFSTSTFSLVGRAIAAILAHPAQTANKFLFVESFNITQLELLAALEKATGKSWTVQKSSTEELKATGQSKMQKGDFSGIGDLIMCAVYSKGFGSDMRTETTGPDNKALGLEVEGDLEGTIKSLL